MTEAPPEQPVVINTQYIKDLSFENPNAPGIYAAMSGRSPELQIALDVRPAQVTSRTYEVLLSLRVQATAEEKTAFLVELDYAGMVTLGESVPQSQVEPLLMIEVPRHLFPFARNTLAAITRDGGFPPLVVNPIDFEQFYQRHKRATTPSQNAGNGPDAPSA